MPGVWRILMARRLLGKELYPASCYSLPGHGVLIDSGTSRFASEVAGEAQAMGIRSVLLTHAHEDHTGAASLISRNLGAECLAHRDAIPALSDPHRLKMHRYRKFFFGIPQACQARPLEDVFSFDDLRLQVIHAPGHSPDHVVFFEKERGYLFSGDAFIPTKDNVFFGIGVDLKAWIRTLRDLAQLHARFMFTGMAWSAGGLRRSCWRRPTGTPISRDRSWSCEKRGGRRGKSRGSFFRRIMPSGGSREGISQRRTSSGPVLRARRPSEAAAVGLAASAGSPML